MTAATVTLALFALGFLTLGALAGAGIYHLAQPWILARSGLPTIRAVLAETERHLLARVLRRSRVRGRHLVGRP